METLRLGTFFLATSWIDVVLVFNTRSQIQKQVLWSGTLDPGSR